MSKFIKVIIFYSLVLGLVSACSHTGPKPAAKNTSTPDYVIHDFHRGYYYPGPYNRGYYPGNTYYRGFYARGYYPAKHYRWID